MSLNSDSMPQSSNNIEANSNINLQLPLSTFGRDILQYHPHLQNLWKQQVAVYYPYVHRNTVQPLDNHTQRVCNHHSMHQF